MQNEIAGVPGGTGAGESHAARERPIGWQPTSRLGAADGQNLTSLVVPAGGTSGMGSQRAAALRALVQFRRMPGVGRSARAQPHL